MKVTVNRNEFLAAFGLCSKVTPTNPERPAYGYVLMDVRDDDILLVANDGQVCMKIHTAHVDYEGLGKVLLPKVRVGSILASHLDDTIVISAESGDAVEVHTPRASYRLNTCTPEDFPPCPTDAIDAVTHVVDADRLVSLVSMTSFAVDRVGTKWATRGVLVESGISEDHTTKLVFVSTDGRRLAQASVTCDIENPDAAGAMKKRGTISPRFVNLMLDCLRGVEGPVSFKISKYRSILEVGRVTLMSQLVSGDFPEYRQVFKKTGGSTIPLNCGSFRSAVAQADAVTDDLNSRAVEFRFSRGEIRLRSGSSEIGSSEVSIPIDVEIEPVDIHLDPKYITQALGVIGDEAEVSLELSGSLAPAVIRVEGRGYTYVVMPMNPSENSRNPKRK